MSEPQPLAIVDLDGVVADVRHRLHHLEQRRKDWDSFFGAAPDDPPHDEGIALVKVLERDHEVVYLTGRPERCRADTEEWLASNGIGGYDVHMRPANDRRPAATVKVELLARLAGDRRVGVVVDDDERVIAAMRRAGHTVFHADWERRAPDQDETLERAQEVEGRT